MLLTEIGTMSAPQIRQEGANHTITAGVACLDSARPDATNAMRLYDERSFPVGPNPWRPDGPSR